MSDQCSLSAGLMLWDVLRQFKIPHLHLHSHVLFQRRWDLRWVWFLFQQHSMCHKLLPQERGICYSTAYPSLCISEEQPVWWIIALISMIFLVMLCFTILCVMLYYLKKRRWNKYSAKKSYANVVSENKSISQIRKNCKDEAYCTGSESKHSIPYHPHVDEPSE